MIPLDVVQRCFREWLGFYNRDNKGWHRLSQDEIDELTYIHWEFLKKSIIGEIENKKQWTVERVKAELPNVVILLNGVHHDAELAGSRCDYPLFIIPAVLDGRLIPHPFVGDWREVADSLNANLPLDILP